MCRRRPRHGHDDRVNLRILSEEIVGKLPVEYSENLLYDEVNNILTSRYV
jgi:hypothetical protein